MRRSGGTRHVITNLQMTLVVVTLVAIGVLLLWRSAGDLTPQWAAVSAQLGGLLVATGLLGVVWELVGRRSLAREIQELAGLSKEVVDAGLVALPRRFYEDTPWADLFRDAQEVDVVVSYARAWRNQHQAELRALANRGRLRVYLPDPDDPGTVARLQERFDFPEAAEGVRSAVRWFRELGPNVEVYVRPGDGLFTCYRFGSTAVLALYTHGPDSHLDVPTLVVRGGTLYGFVMGEIQAIADQSHSAS